MNLTVSMCETFFIFPNNLMYFFKKKNTLFVNVIAKFDWSIHVRWLTLVHVFEMRSAFGGTVTS